MREAVLADSMPLPARGSPSVRRGNKRAVRKYLASPKGQAHLAARDERRRLHLLRLQEIKVATGCMDCPSGTAWPPEALQFDHVPERGAKRFHVTQACTRTWRLLVEEMTKCDVVCASHHASRTVGRRN